MIKKYISAYFELTVWVAGLLCLAFIDPSAETHFSLCFFKWAGLSFCPGCGLGHSIAWLFHGNIKESLQAHPLGIVAVPVLLFRIFSLLKNNFFHLTNLK
ncbi:MAG: DUF2752 domain-containing protein [Gloeobacteraceae cyanobacterium ES-bin-316]|nr:DUF2752 domain-containing protein [Ferruginibacter sp.]